MVLPADCTCRGKISIGVLSAALVEGASHVAETVKRVGLHQCVLCFDWLNRGVCCKKATFRVILSQPHQKKRCENPKCCAIQTLQRGEFSRWLDLDLFTTTRST